MRNRLGAVGCRLKVTSCKLGKRQIIDGKSAKVKTAEMQRNAEERREGKVLLGRGPTRTGQADKKMGAKNEEKRTATRLARCRSLNGIIGTGVR